MALIVQKFGGTSVKDAERIRNVADIVTKKYQEGNDVVVVVSAQGDTTDDFIAKAAELNSHPSAREMDVLLSAGEQISMALLAMTIENMGFPAVSLTGWQAGIKTDLNYSSARIRKIDPERVRSLLDRKKIVIVAGFQGISPHNSITTLGRGGSDTTAVALAAVLHADLCQIYTDVDGVYTADPRVVSNAVKLDEITYDEMLELATLGAQVLHNRSVEMAKRYNVDLEVISSLTRNPGTKVKEVVSLEKMIISGVACDKHVTRIAVMGIKDAPGMAFKLFGLLAKENISVDIILQSIGRGDMKDISFTVAEGDGERAVELLKQNQKSIGFQDISMQDGLAKLSIVGAGMASNAGVAAKLFDALASKMINVRMISTSEIKISVIINGEDADRAVKAVHAKFFD
ncbi:MAG: aspartate kinase [Butyricicoccaceae bacterium]